MPVLFVCKIGKIFLSGISPMQKGGGWFASVRGDMQSVSSYNT